MLSYFQYFKAKNYFLVGGLTDLTIHHFAFNLCLEMHSL